MKTSIVASRALPIASRVRFVKHVYASTFFRTHDQADGSITLISNTGRRVVIVRMPGEPAVEYLRPLQRCSQRPKCGSASAPSDVRVVLAAHPLGVFHL